MSREQRGIGKHTSNLLSQKWKCILLLVCWLWFFYILGHLNVQCFTKEILLGFPRRVEWLVLDHETDAGLEVYQSSKFCSANLGKPEWDTHVIFYICNVFLLHFEIWWSPREKALVLVLKTEVTICIFPRNTIFTWRHNWEINYDYSELGSLVDNLFKVSMLLNTTDNIFCNEKVLAFKQK